MIAIDPQTINTLNTENGPDREVPLEAQRIKTRP